MQLFDRYFKKTNETTFVSEQPDYVELSLNRLDAYLMVQGIKLPITFGYRYEENVNTINIAGIECKLWQAQDGIRVHDPREKSSNYNQKLFDCLENEDGSVCYYFKKIDPLLNYKGKSINGTIKGYLEKFNKRGNFFSIVGDMVTLPHIDQTMVYGDRDVEFYVQFSTWEDWWGHSPRNIVIEGEFPIHLSKNNKMSFGHDVNWGYSGQSRPTNIPNLNFNFYNDSKIMEDEEGNRIPNFGMSFMSIRDIVGQQYLEDLLMDLFHKAFFARHTNTLAVDNR